MSACLGRAQHIAGNDSQNQSGRNRQQQGRAHGNPDAWRGSGGVLAGRTLRGGQSQTQIVRGGQTRIQQADDGQPNRAAANRR